MEREAARRAVLNAVLGLAEPYRETLLLRFYEGLPPREIARRMDARIDTVSSRLRRGLAEVRARLQSPEDSQSTVLSLIPFAVGGDPSTLGFATNVAWKVIAMNTKAKVTIAACVLVATGAAVFQGLKRESPDSSETVTSPDTKDLEPPAIVGSGSIDSTARPIVREDAASPLPEPQGAASTLATGGLVLHAKYERDGAPAARVMIAVTCSGDPNPYASTRHVLTDSNGEVRLDELPVGSVLVQCSLAQAHLRSKILRDQTVEENLSIPPGGLVEGIVLDTERHPVSGAGIYLTGMILDSESEGAIVTESDASGRFSIRDVNEIQYVGARLEGRAPSPLLQVFTGPGQTIAVELVLGSSPGVLEGGVETSEGEKIANARVRLDPKRDRSLGFPKQMDSVPYRVTADSAGRFRIADLAPGRYELQTASPGRAVATQPVEIVAGGVTRVLSRLLKSGRLVGTVKTSGGDPVERAAIHSKDFGGSLDTFFIRSDAYGAFAIDSMPLGEIEVFVESTAGNLERSLVFASGEETRFDAVIASGLSIRGRIVDDLGAPLAGLPLMATRLGPKMAIESATTDQAGAFEVKNLSPGRYDLEVYPKNGGTFMSHAEHGVEAGASDVLITLPRSSLPSVRLVGRVVDPRGNPVAGAEYDFQRSGTKGSSGILFTAAPSGAIDAGPVPPGEYSVTVRVPGYCEIRSPKKTAAPNETVDFGVLALQAGQILKIHFVRPAALAATPVGMQISDGSLEHSFGWERDGEDDLDAKSSPLAPGVYRVFVSGAGVARTYADVEVKAGVDASLDMPLVPSLDRVVRIVERTRTNDLDLPIRVYDAKGVLIVGRSVARDDPSDAFLVRLALAAGKYAVVAAEGTPREKRTPFEVSDRDAAEVAVELP